MAESRRGSPLTTLLGEQLNLTWTMIPTPPHPSATKRQRTVEFLLFGLFQLFRPISNRENFERDVTIVYLNSTMAIWTMIRGFKIKCETGPAA